MRVIGWTVAGWISIVPLAIANGALRQALLIPRCGVRAAQPISGFLLMVAIAGVAWVLVGRIGPQRLPVWIGIGCGWLLATLAFEFGMGLSAGRNWGEMLAPYRFVDNNIWPVVLVWVASAPGVLALARRCTSP